MSKHLRLNASSMNPDLKRSVFITFFQVERFPGARSKSAIHREQEPGVGEIDVGYDFDEYSPKKRHQLEEVEPDVYVMDARIPVSEAAEVLGVHLSDRDAHTVGGLVTAQLRRIPKVGDRIEEAGFLFVVEDANDRAPLRIRVRPLWET